MKKQKVYNEGTFDDYLESQGYVPHNGDKNGNWTEGKNDYSSITNGIWRKYIKGESYIMYGLGEVGFPPCLLYPKFIKITRTPRPDGLVWEDRREFSTPEIIAFERGDYGHTHAEILEMIESDRRVLLADEMK